MSSPPPRQPLLPPLKRDEEDDEIATTPSTTDSNISSCGSATFSYSSSSQSSSVESIHYTTTVTTNSSSNTSGGANSSCSTLENGELAVFTFLKGNYTAAALSYFPEDTSSSSSLPSYHHGHKSPSNNCTCNSHRISNLPSYYEVSRDDDSNTRRRRMCHYCSLNVKQNSDFMYPASKNRDSFSNLISSSSSYTNLDGNILRSLEKGVLYPVIHWSPKSSDDDVIANPPHHNHNHYGNDATMPHSYNKTSPVFNQGVYRELNRVIPPDACIHKSSPSSPCKRPTWLILGYKSLDKTLNPALRTTWKEWTGTRHIYLNLRHDFDIERISFYHRVTPQDNLDLFMYLVCMQIGNVDDTNVMWLLDFVQRSRVERMKGFLTVYAQVEQTTTIWDEYAKCCPEPKNLKKQNAKISDNDDAMTISVTSLQQDLSGKKFIEKLLQELQDTPLVEYF